MSQRLLRHVRHKRLGFPQATRTPKRTEPALTVGQIALLDVFEGMPDVRRKQGRRQKLPLCLALFTLAVTAGNQGFLAIGDWLKSYKQLFQELFEVDIIPSYSTIRRSLLPLDYKEYSARLAQCE